MKHKNILNQSQVCAAAGNCSNHKCDSYLCCAAVDSNLAKWSTIFALYSRKRLNEIKVQAVFSD